jgi:hypothetical protein
VAKKKTAEYEIHYFDEEGKPQIKKGKLPVEDLLWCSDPVRFVGGGCERYFTCDRAGANTKCLAKPTKAAQEKKDQADEEGAEEIDGTAIAKQFREKCAMCDKLLPLEEFERCGFYGDEGTTHSGKKICETCYYEDTSEPAATVYYGAEDDDGEGPKRIGSCRNETDGDFTVSWHSTDPWRGYYEMQSERYVRVFDDAILSGHESEEMLKKLYDYILKRFEEEEIHYARAFARSSNLFMTCLEIWVQKDLVQLLKAHMIIATAKVIADYDNPLFKTGILMPREELGRMKSLLQNKYKLETDYDLMALVTEKGQSLVEEIMEAAHA